MKKIDEMANSVPTDQTAFYELKSICTNTKNYYGM